MEPERSVKDWIKLLREYPDTHVRRKAAEELGKLGDPKAVKPLISALEKDPEGSVRGAAARALGELGDHRAVKPLIKALGIKTRLSTFREARTLLTTGNIHFRGEISSEVRTSAAIALGRIGNPRAIKPLRRAFRYHEEHARKQAALALRMIEDRKALSHLVDTLEQDPSIEVRRSAAQALQGRTSWLEFQRRSRIELIIRKLLEEETPEVLPSEIESSSFPVVSEVPVRVFCRFCGARISIEEEVCPKCNAVQ